MTQTQTESNNGLYFIVGGIAVSLVILAGLFFTGRLDTNQTAPSIKITAPAFMGSDHGAAIETGGKLIIVKP
jgi:hypothetical protein